MRTAIFYILSLSLHGIAAAALTFLVPPERSKLPGFSVAPGGGGRGGPAPQFVGSFRSSREIAQRLARLRIEPAIRTAKPSTALSAVTAVAKKATAPVRPASMRTQEVPPPTRSDAQRPKTILDAGPKLVATKPLARAKPSVTASDLVAAHAAPALATRAAALDSATFNATNSRSSSDNKEASTTTTSGYQAVSGRIARQVQGPAGDGLPAGPGGSGGRRSPLAAISNPPPPYPPEALSRGIEGRVVLRVWIREDGSVRDVKIHQSSGDTTLDESALSTVRDRWQFTPARESGRPVPWDGLLPIRFRLRGDVSVGG